MRELPILFSTPMVQAILAGKKTQTRRIVKYSIPARRKDKGFKGEIHQKPDWWKPSSEFRPISFSEGLIYHIDEPNEPWAYCDFESMPVGKRGTHWMSMLRAPYGKPGDWLWVRESFRTMKKGIDFKADHDYRVNFKWKPSIHMPKTCARIWLKETDLRLERLQDISEADAIAEGVLLHERGEKWLDYLAQEANITQFIYRCRTAKESFKTLWELVHGRGSWDFNPWVWVPHFEVLSTTGRQTIK